MSIHNFVVPTTLKPKISNFSFRSFVDELAKEKRDAVFYHSGAEQAAYVMSKMFDAASKSIKIFNGGFTGEISNNSIYREALRKYLASGGSLQILTNNKEIANSSLFELIRFYKYLSPSKIEVYITNKKIISATTDAEIHFMVADEIMYRLEDDVKTFSSESNFNSSDSAQSLVKIFDSILNMGATKFDFNLPEYKPFYSEMKKIKKTVVK